MPFVLGSLLQEKSSTSYNDTTQYHIWDSGINKNQRNPEDCQCEEFSPLFNSAAFYQQSKEFLDS